MSAVNSVRKALSQNDAYTINGEKLESSSTFYWLKSPRFEDERNRTVSSLESQSLVTSLKKKGYLLGDKLKFSTEMDDSTFNVALLLWASTEISVSTDEPQGKRKFSKDVEQGQTNKTYACCPSCVITTFQGAGVMIESIFQNNGQPPVTA